MPSPLLGAEGWSPTCQLLAAHGHDVELVEPAAPNEAREVLAGFMARLAPETCVLVAHSNAGNYLPALVASAPAGTCGVFVDCEVPPPEGAFGAATGPRLEQLRSMADADGQLPPWPLWWDRPTWEATVLDAEARARIEAVAPRPRLAYFEQALVAPTDWWRGRFGYLRFQESFEPHAEKASQLGWPVCRLSGTHLHMVNDPAATAQALSTLLDVCAQSV